MSAVRRFDAVLLLDCRRLRGMGAYAAACAHVLYYVLLLSATGWAGRKTRFTHIPGCFVRGGWAGRKLD